MQSASLVSSQPEGQQLSLVNEHEVMGVFWQEEPVVPGFRQESVVQGLLSSQSGSEEQMMSQEESVTHRVSELQLEGSHVRVSSLRPRVHDPAAQSPGVQEEHVQVGPPP